MVIPNLNMDLFALYKTQYKLTATTSTGKIKKINDLPPYAEGYAGWFDSGTQIQYSVNPLEGFLNIPPQLFDRWTGDVSGQNEDYESVGSLTIDGPKNISAN
jgi:hypothetical protein